MNSRNHLVIMAAALLTNTEVTAHNKTSSGFVLLENIQTHDDPSETTIQFSDGSSFSYTCDQRRIERGVLAFESTPALVIRNRCSKSGSKPRGSVIWIHGGPFAAYGDAQNPPAEQSALLMMGYEIIVPLYPGSADREYHYAAGQITPNMGDAVRELEAVILAQQSVEWPVILIGESFGAFLAATVASRLREDRGDRLILISPMIRSLKDHAIFDKIPQVDATLQFKGMGDERHSELSKQERNARIETLVRAFFGTWLEADLISMLRTRPPAKLSVIYGDKDSKIDPQYMAQLMAIGSGRYRSLVYPGADHEPARNRAELDTFVNFVTEALR